MRWLVIAGGTVVPIDRVRAISNGATGRTGAAIAAEARRRGHRVTLLTSEPETAESSPSADVRAYRTFDDLYTMMAELIGIGEFDCVVHSAAVSDYQAAGVYSAATGTSFDPTSGTWRGEPPRFLDRGAKKLRSDEPDLWLRLVRTPKLIDLVRGEWGFRGVLVKFKLEVGIDDDQLLALAERSRRQSDADLMVANTLEAARDWAYFGPLAGKYTLVPRPQLAAELVTAVERIIAERGHG
jgi:phosphopantothenoylcysteine synthetase/decarboxylase